MIICIMKSTCSFPSSTVSSRLSQGTSLWVHAGFSRKKEAAGAGGGREGGGRKEGGREGGRVGGKKGDREVMEGGKKGEREVMEGGEVNREEGRRESLFQHKRSHQHSTGELTDISHSGALFTGCLHRKSPQTRGVEHPEDTTDVQPSHASPSPLRLPLTHSTHKPSDLLLSLTAGFLESLLRLSLCCPEKRVVR